MKPILLFLSLVITSLGFSQKDTVYTFYIGGSNILYDFFEVNNDRCQIHFYGGGCLTTDSIEKIKEQHNSVTDTALRNRFGENWRELYDAQVIEREQKRLRIDSILVHQNFLKKRLERLNLVHEQLQISYGRTNRNNWTTVWLFYYKQDNYDEFESWRLYKLKVNLDQGNVKVVNKRNKPE